MASLKSAGPTVEGFAGLCKLSLHTRWIPPKLQNGQVYVLRSSQRVKKGSFAAKYLDRQKPGGDVHAQYHLKKKESHRV